MMIPRIATKSFVILSLLLCVRAQAYSQQTASQTSCYPDAPPVLLAKIKDGAKDIVNAKNGQGDADKLGAFFNDIFLYTVADAIAPPNAAVPLRTLEAYQYLGETARTDKQTGSSAKSAGSTTVVEKPGFAQLLSFAIEHGAIQQQVNGTSLTLSTSPYAFVAMVEGDTAKTYRDTGFLNRIGASATFNISNQDMVLENVNRQQLTEWSIRVRLYGDRSTRSKQFQDFWMVNIKPNIQRRLNVITGAQSLIGDDSKLEPIREKMVGPATDPESKVLSLRDKIADYLNTHATETVEKKTSDIEEMILCHLKTFLFDRIRSGSIDPDPKTKSAITTQVIPSLVQAHQELQQARDLLDQYLAEFTKGPLLTFGYTNHRTSMGSDYSDFELLYEQDAQPVKVLANAWVSIYNKPNPMLNQERVRDFGAALSLEAKIKNPIHTTDADLSKWTLSFSGRYQRMKENTLMTEMMQQMGMPKRKADIAVAQFKLEIPIAMGVSLPLSITYANATELIKETEVRGNFGITFDVDKLYALTRQILKP